MLLRRLSRLLTHNLCGPALGLPHILLTLVRLRCMTSPHPPMKSKHWTRPEPFSILPPIWGYNGLTFCPRRGVRQVCGAIFEKTRKSEVIMNRRSLRLAAVCLLALCALPSAFAQQPKKKPNILVIWGDDVGYWNISAYNQGMMGYHTPNIDRLAKEGAIFTDFYAQPSCTAGRASFILG